MDEGDLRAPRALSRNAPVAQAPHGRALAPALMFGARVDRGFGFVDRHAVEEVAVHELAGAGIGFGPRALLCDLVAVGDYAVDGQDRKKVVSGEGVYVHVDLGSRRITKQKKTNNWL